ncbi:MAG: hypothetical protein WBJ10_00900 [Daejeonella sp.]|uniref:HYC_CC_PP family protein n=1 Tax=Daejeonella sp. TaxID=2805397 RepID=UPI003C73A684
MKKFIVTILAVFYLGVASGATMHFHYCMGTLIDLGLVSEKSKDCSNCGMEAEESEKCCTKESKQVQVDEAQRLNDNPFQFKTFTEDLSWNRFSFLPEFYPVSLIEEKPLANAPPVKDNTPVFIRNCNFRI